MKLSEKMAEAINKQINEEFYSAYLYLAMASYLESQKLKGAATWMEIQYQEEISHAMKFYAYMNERGARVVLKAIKEPQKEWNSMLEVFEDAYKHEQYITSLINDLANLAMEEKDHATLALLQWFINEQVEEEANTSEIVDKINFVKDSPNGLYMLDRELGQRPATTTTQGEEQA
ncbi:ferritin [Mesoaciditoga sp.]